MLRGCVKDGRFATRVRGSTPHKRWRRFIVLGARSWRAAGVAEHSSVDRPRWRWSRSLTPSDQRLHNCTKTSQVLSAPQGAILSPSLAFYNLLSAFTS
ncbi:unnamed protein product [Arctia plantaginis]|uniref:Uncharacterized protein n=1 Tax=Arctia plantaginis TaxID=874455 RepID=A0A8S1BHN5_ARCPL|nr:unnamed protein product [Arctia plantaginis]